MEIDWLQASEDERKRLYIATRAVTDATNTSIEAIMDKALGRKILMGTDYQSNFRRGKIRKAYAKLIYEYLAEHHVEIARKIAPDLFTLPHTTAWEQLIETQGIDGRLHAVPITKRMGLTARRSNIRMPTTDLRLNQDYCFELDSDMDGHAVAFEGYQGQWHSLPLGADDRHPTAKIIQGRQFMPVDANDNPIALVETDDIGLHQFVIVLGADPDLPVEIDAIAERHASMPMEIHSLIIRFTA